MIYYALVQGRGARHWHSPAPNRRPQGASYAGACSDPASLPGVQYPKLPPKLEALTEAVTEIVDAGESALIFTQFISTLERTTAELKKAGVPVFTLYGAVSRSRRETILKEFNSLPDGAALIMTLKTGGVGLNLTKASYVFHLEPWWNPAVEDQATDRAHRLGQSRSVQVYRYIMHESVEEKIEFLKAKKKQRFDAIFSDAESSLPEASSENLLAAGGTYISRENFRFLLETT